MNRYLSTKTPSLVLLIVMLLNPIVGLAGSLIVEKASIPESSANTVQLMGMLAGSEENCHEHLVSTSELPESNMQSECCEMPCECAQSGCHAPIASINTNDTALFTSTSYVYSRFTSYLSPSLTTFTPPPII